MTPKLLDIETICPKCDTEFTVTYVSHEAEAHAAQLETDRDEARRQLEQALEACRAARDWFARNTKQGHEPGPVEQKLIDVVGMRQS